MRRAECVAFLQWCLPQLGLRWPGFRKVRSQVCKRLARRVQELGLPDLAAYRAHLETRPKTPSRLRIANEPQSATPEVLEVARLRLRPSDAASRTSSRFSLREGFPAGPLEEHEGEWTRVDAMCRITISRLYRDRGVFEVLVDEVLPVLAAEAKQRTAATVRCLSCGCASGEEPYTLAIAWHCALAGRFPGVELALTATDVDPHLLDRARAGVYSPRTVRELPPAWRQRAFAQVGDELRMREPFRTGIVWMRQDVRTEMPAGPFDLVLCRNLAFTYFDDAGQLAVLHHLADRVRRGGFLVIGKHETLPGEHAGFRPWCEHLRIYRRV